MKTREYLMEVIKDAAEKFEFERLKEFCIRVKKDGDFLYFNHRGNITKTAKYTPAIFAYLHKQNLHQYLK